MAVTINASTSSGLQLTSDTSGAIAFQNNGTTAATIDSSGNVGIGTTTPTQKLHVLGNIIIGGSGNLFSTDTNSTWTLAGGNTYQNGGSILVGGSASPIISGGIIFATGTGTTNNERMRIDSSGNVLVTNAAGLGYGTGAGGTVTQATSKSTAVTLNKPTGQIVTNNAALGASGTVSFVLNNSLIATTDNVIVNTVGNGNYLVQCITNGVGTATIRITNITGVSLSEQFNIQFSIIKGATA